MIPLHDGRDVRAGDLGLVKQSNYVDAAVFMEAGQATIPVPAGASYCGFSTTVDFACRIGGEAFWPSATITDGTACEINPAQRRLGSATSIGLASSGPGVITVSFYG